jgi:hypothetical protein
MVKPEKYQIGTTSVFNIRNRNETRVAKLLTGVLAEFPDYTPEILDIQDIYALTLNKLKPRYAQEVTIVLNEPVTDEMIKSRLRQAIRRIQKYPSH